MIHIKSNLWLTETGRNHPMPLLEDGDFWQAMVQPTWMDPTRPVTVLELLSTARVFGEAIDQWLAELNPQCDYETWIAELLTTRPEPLAGELRVTWQPVLNRNALQEWYRCLLVGSTLAGEPSLAQLLDLPVVLDSQYSLYNPEGERVFYTQKPFRLLDVLAALLETLLYFDGPNERSVYLELTRLALRSYFETERLRVG